jgi:Ca2+-transporting ATPase
MPRGRDAETELCFLGLIGMMDPPRPQAKEAVAICKRAGIRPVMVTGDHAATAEAIARELGLLTGKAGIMTGPELDAISDGELRRTISRYSVFARVSPEHKSRIVKAYQRIGEIVAMTGDGVNDAPALKCADIGCAMGQSGTDVARDASDMILADDNFGTIVEAVRQGRGIYQNIRKTVHFLLSSNIGEILIILVSFILGRSSPLIPIQLLWINLVTDSLPALALGAEKADSDIMKKKPVDPGAGMFAGGRGLRIILQGLMIGALALAAFEMGSKQGSLETARTFAFAVLGLSQLVHAFNVRSDASVFKIGFFSNRYMIGAFIVCAALQVSVICIPGLAEIFGTVPLSLTQWRTVALLALTPLAVVEIAKLFKLRR